METDFIFWRHITPVGVKVEEVSGGEDRSGAIWRALARQVYCENGRYGYRDLHHRESGAPYLEGGEERISLTHTVGLLAVASLPRTPEADLEQFSTRTALGIDAERWDREKVCSLRKRFLSEEELHLVPEDDVRAGILAWTAKEALYKAALMPGLDFRRDLRILSLPDPETGTVGRAWIRRGEEVEMELYAYTSEDCCVTLAYSPKCAKYKKK